MISTLSDFQSVQVTPFHIAACLFVLSGVLIRIIHPEISVRPAFPSLLRAPPAFF
jgi:uncharacterized protein with PQ loop repeat